MLNYNNINNNEKGLSVRAKINNMFNALVSGKDGINSLWSSFSALLNSVKNNSEELQEFKEAIKEQILACYGYTDIQISDLTSYINGMNGGISDFAMDTSYKPNFPEDKVATVLALGSGTYTYLLDENEDPITIKEATALTVFYKGANVSYWKYKSIALSNFLGFKNISLTQGTNNYSQLDDYDSFENVGVYILYADSYPSIVGRLDVYMSWGGTIVQRLLSFKTENSGTAIDTVTVMVRSKSANSGKWSEWKPYQSSFIGTDKVGRHFNEDNIAPSVREFKKIYTYFKIVQWSGKVVKDVDVQLISKSGSDPQNIVFDSVKGTFLYEEDSVYRNSWDTLSDYQELPYSSNGTPVNLNLRAFFKTLDNICWIAISNSSIEKIFSNTSVEILPFDGFVSGVQTESVGAISVTSVVYDTAKGKFLGSNLLKYYDFWPATASYKADADYNDTDTNKAKDILFVNTSNGVVYKGPKLLNIQGGGSSVTVDSVLSLTSVNPVQNKIITEAINKLNESVFPLSLSVAGGGTFKKGTTQSITVRWTVKEGSDIVTPDTVKVNDVSVTNTSTSKVFNGVTTTTSYKVEVTKGSITKSASTTATFVNPSYIGVVANDFSVTDSNITSLTEIVKTSKGYTATGLNLNNQKVCYAYPKSFGILSSIKDGNGFENIGSYTQSELTVNGETYYVYVLTTAATISNLKQIYA